MDVDGRLKSRGGGAGPRARTGDQVRDVGAHRSGDDRGRDVHRCPCTSCRTCTGRGRGSRATRCRFGTSRGGRSSPRSSTKRAATGRRGRGDRAGGARRRPARAGASPAPAARARRALRATPRRPQGGHAVRRAVRGRRAGRVLRRAHSHRPAGGRGDHPRGALGRLRDRPRRDSRRDPPPHAESLRATQATGFTCWPRPTRPTCTARSGFATTTPGTCASSSFAAAGTGTTASGGRRSDRWAGRRARSRRTPSAARGACRGSRSGLRGSRTAASSACASTRRTR